MAELFTAFTYNQSLRPQCFGVIQEKFSLKWTRKYPEAMLTLVKLCIQP